MTHDLFARGLARRVALAVSVALALGAAAARLGAQEAASGPDRGSFTLIVDLGVGLQHDGYIGQTERGWAGLNLGAGGFLTDDVALLFRLTGTTANHGAIQQSSGVMGPTVQYWLDDRFFVGGGFGVGFGCVRCRTDGGVGFILGGGYTLLNRGKHNLQIGMEYAPAFTAPEAVHSLGFTVGWQLL